MEEGVMLLALGREAADLFAERPGTDQRKLLNFMVSNAHWGNGTLTIEWREPFGLCEQFADAATSTQPHFGAIEGAASRMVSLVGRFANWIAESGASVREMWDVEVCGSGLQNRQVEMA
jgi:hypothetical protein